MIRCFLKIFSLWPLKTVPARFKKNSHSPFRCKGTQKLSLRPNQFDLQNEKNANYHCICSFVTKMDGYFYSVFMFASRVWLVWYIKTIIWTPKQFFPPRISCSVHLVCLTIQYYITPVLLTVLFDTQCRARLTREHGLTSCGHGTVAPGPEQEHPILEQHLSGRVLPKALAGA